jgi:hypothetical protein
MPPALLADAGYDHEVTRVHRSALMIGVPANAQDTIQARTSRSGGALLDVWLT